MADDSICVFKLWLIECGKVHGPLNYTRNPLLFMEPECLWELAVGPCPELEHYRSHTLLPYFLKIHFNIIPLSTLVSSKRFHHFMPHLSYPLVASSLLGLDVILMMWYIGSWSASHSSHLYVLNKVLKIITALLLEIEPGPSSSCF